MAGPGGPLRGGGPGPPLGHLDRAGQGHAGHLEAGKEQPKVEAALRDGKLSENRQSMITDAAAANPAAEQALLDDGRER